MFPYLHSRRKDKNSELIGREHSSNRICSKLLRECDFNLLLSLVLLLYQLQTILGVDLDEMIIMSCSHREYERNLILEV